MDEFSALGTKITSLINNNKTLTPVNKSDILSHIENNILLLNTMIDIYKKNTILFKSIAPKFNQNGSDLSATVKQIYSSYLKELSHSCRRMEENNFLSSFFTTATQLLSDHNMIREQFDTCFKEGTDVADITPEQLRLSHAVLLGFINLTALFSDWFCFFVDLLGNDTTPPPYRTNFLNTNIKTVASFVVDVNERGKSRSIISIIQNVRKEGDVTLYHKSATLDSYADIRNYSGVKGLLSHFNIFLWIQDVFASWSYNKYKRNVMMRDWIQAKIIALQMKLDNVPVDSADYQKQLAIIQRYSDQLSAYDKTIANYDKSLDQYRTT